MDLNLDSKVCFVAGSSRGIGLGIARKLLDEGARVVVTGRDPAALQAAADELAQRYSADRVLQIPGDLGHPVAAEAAVQRVINHWGTIDCLIANVGTGRSLPGWEIGREVWDASFDINLWPTLATVRAVLSEMTRKSSGSIVVIGSITGVEATPAPLAYSAAKAALANYVANLARLVGPSGVRVNYLAPGNIHFPGGGWERRQSEQPVEVENMLAAEVPLNRFGSVEEIADIAAFLASPRSSFVTGAVIVADGGQTRSY